jgi:hypothetical protein
MNGFPLLYQLIILDKPRVFRTEPERSLFFFMVNKIHIALLLAVFLTAPVSAYSANKQASPAALPYASGEKLTYDISWSDILKAGVAVMEVRAENADGRPVYHFISTARSVGVVHKVYTVADTVESVIDAVNLCPVTYRLDQHHGKRIKKREMTFNHREETVTVRSDGTEAAYSVPPDVQDALSSLYFVRAQKEFTVGKPITLHVHEDGKTWAVEVHTLGREKLKTAFGELNTIKIKTYPKYEGVFQHKGEIYIWLTDDARKIPVLMKSEISIGSILTTLVGLELGKETK